MAETDAAAIGRTLAGDGDGFRVLVERYSPAVFRLAYRMTANESDAEDVVQETFLRAYRHLAQYDQRAAFSTWLYRIAANYALDQLGSKRRKVEVQPAEERDDQPAVEAVCGAPSPERLAEGGLLQERLKEAMKELTALERTAFTLRHFEEQSVAEIADALQMAPGAARQAVFRAVHKLRGALAAWAGVRT